MSGYDNSGALSKRSAGLGYGISKVFTGNKGRLDIYSTCLLSSLFLILESPSPDKYNISSQFDLKDLPTKTAFGKPK